jgi:MFS family permease
MDPHSSETTEPAAASDAMRAVQPSEPPYPSPWKAWFTVAVLVGIYMNSFLDRQILGLLVEDIKASLTLTDTQMGLIGGPAFAIFYAFGGLPIGYLVDRKSRPFIIVFGQIFWTMASFSCGLSKGFGQLFGSRIGVGIGEATLSPSAYSIIADSFPMKKIATALGVYGVGISIGANLAPIIGALIGQLMEAGETITLPVLGERYRWQIVFFIICLPTIPLTFMMMFIRDPFRRNVRRKQDADGVWRMAKPPRGELVAYLRKNWKTVGCHNIGYAWLAFSGYGIAYWLPAFYMRRHGFSMTEVGFLIGFTGLIVGTAGTLFGGWVTDKIMAMGYRDAKMRVGVIASFTWIPFGFLYPLMDSWQLAWAFMVPTVFVGFTTIGVAPAAIQEIMPNSLRGQASAIFLFFNSLIGLGLAPLTIGLATDYLFEDEMKLHYSILLVGFAAHLFAALFLWLGMKHYRKTLDDLEDWNARSAI